MISYVKSQSYIHFIGPLGKNSFICDSHPYLGEKIIYRFSKVRHKLARTLATLIIYNSWHSLYKPHSVNHSHYFMSMIWIKLYIGVAANAKLHGAAVFTEFYR